MDVDSIRWFPLIGLVFHPAVCLAKPPSSPENPDVGTGLVTDGPGMQQIVLGYI